MKIFILVFFIVQSTHGISQVQTEASGNQGNLNAMYFSIKSKAETYQDYKVIKEVKLDEFWKVVMDSVKRMKSELKQANITITKLNDDVKNADDKVISVQASVAGIVHDSTHISFFGVSFTKWFFNLLFLIATGTLALFIVFLLGQTRLVNQSIKEKSERLNLLADEFEQYKRKSLEKEKKLSRELQTERNKLLEIKRT